MIHGRDIIFFVCIGTYSSGHFIWNLSNEPLSSLISLYEMSTSVKSYLSYDLSSANLSPSNDVNFNENGIVVTVSC